MYRCPFNALSSLRTTSYQLPSTLYPSPALQTPRAVRRHLLLTQPILGHPLMLQMMQFTEYNAISVATATYLHEDTCGIREVFLHHLTAIIRPLRLRVPQRILEAGVKDSPMPLPLLVRHNSARIPLPHEGEVASLGQSHPESALESSELGWDGSTLNTCLSSPPPPRYHASIILDNVIHADPHLWSGGIGSRRATAFNL